MKKLQVPENITLRPEVWRGVGKAELAAILGMTAAAAVVAGIFCLISTGEGDMLIAMFAVIMTFGVGVGLFSKIENNQSIYDFFRRKARYKREQQAFPWKKQGKEICELVEKEKDE